MGKGTGLSTRQISLELYGEPDRRPLSVRITPELEAFLADLDMFYLGTANAQGQPYIQYRGGAPGFLKAIDEKTLGFADFGGNQQYISLGNLSENPKAFIFLMDYVHSRRIKLWGTARVVEGDAQLENKLRDAEYPGKIERVILFEIEAWDINCPQHIHKRFAQREVAPVVEQLQERMQELEAQLATLRQTNSLRRQIKALHFCEVRNPCLTASNSNDPHSFPSQGEQDASTSTCRSNHC